MSPELNKLCETIFYNDNTYYNKDIETDKCRARNESIQSNESNESIESNMTSNETSNETSDNKIEAGEHSENHNRKENKLSSSETKYIKNEISDDSKTESIESNEISNLVKLENLDNYIQVDDIQLVYTNQIKPDMCLAHSIENKRMTQPSRQLSYQDTSSNYPYDSNDYSVNIDNQLKMARKKWKQSNQESMLGLTSLDISRTVPSKKIASSISRKRKKRKKDNTQEEDDHIIHMMDTDRRNELGFRRETFWKACFGIVIDKRATQYFVQVVIGSCVMTFCMAKIWISNNCDTQEPTCVRVDTTVYFSLLSALVGFYIPSPSLHASAPTT
jgi:hypothetical protein